MAKEQDSAMRADDSLSEGSEPRVYELGFHLDPELPTEEVKRAYQAVRANIAEQSTVVAEGEPVMVQLAYTISRQETAGRRDFASAHFCWIAYEATPENHAEVIASASADKRIIRFIDLLTTKDMARHAVEMQELLNKAQKRTSDPEVALDAELDAALESAVV